MAETPSIGGGDSTRVGGAHIDLTLRGAEQVKAQAEGAAAAVGGKLAPALNQVDGAAASAGKAVADDPTATDSAAADWVWIRVNA